MKHGILQTKAAKRGVRSAVCLLLALMMTVSDTLKLFPPMEAEALDTEEHTLYKWNRINAGTELAKLTADKRKQWVPVLIGYRASDGTEYYIDLRTVTKGEKGYVDSRTSDLAARTAVLPANGFLAANWTEKANTNDYPSLVDSNREFWTLDDPLTDIAVFPSDQKDAEWGKYPTYLIGRNINWGDGKDDKTRLDLITDVKSAEQLLILADSFVMNFDTEKGEGWKKGKEWRANSFKNWTFAGAGDQGTVSDKKCPDMNLKSGEFRIMAQHEDELDSNLKTKVVEENKVKRNYVSAEYDSGYNYTDGIFSVWTGEKYNLTVLNKDHTVDPSLGVDLLNIKDPMLIKEGKTLTIMPGATLTIDTTLYNNGTILNYGTIFLLEGASIRTLNPMENGKASQNCGKIICSGSADNGRNFTGEGNLITFQNSSIIFDEGANLFKVQNGATVELNGTMVCPNTFTLDNANIYIRPKGMLISQYAVSDRFTQIKDMTITRAASRDGKLSTTFPKMKEMNKSAVPQPFTTTGSCKFTNEGYFAHLTESKSAQEAAAAAAEAARSEEEKRLNALYFSKPVWTESIYDYTDLADYKISPKATAYWGLNTNYSANKIDAWIGEPIYINTMNVRGDEQALSNPGSPFMVNLYTFLNCYVANNIEVYDTECPSSQVSKSFRGELVTIERTMTRRYEAKYLLDSSGWYATCEISPLWGNILPWSEAQPNWANAYEMRGWSVRRLWEPIIENGKWNGWTMLKEGHYDPASDTFITYDYQKMLKYVEYYDGSVEVYRFSGSWKNEVDGEFLAGKVGTAYVNLRDEIP